MTVIKGTQSITPIYKGVDKIGKIYKGENLYYVLDDIPAEFIKPFVVPENANTNLVFNTTIKDSSAPYKTNVVSGGNLYMVGGNNSGYYNGILDKTANSNFKDLYIPSTYNGVQVYSLSWGSFRVLYEIYPNLENIILGEGIEVLGEASISYHDGATALENKPKIVLPKSLKNISYGALGSLRVYKLDTSKYTFFTDMSRLDKPVENLDYCLSNCHVDICYVNNPIFENNYATSSTNTTSFSPLSGSTVDTLKTTFKKMYVKNLTKIGQNAVYSQKIEYLEIDKSITSLSALAFNSCTFTEIKFKHSNSDNIEFLLDSSNYGPFHSKTAIAVNIYTDNNYIKNHDWVTNENITPTFYHLDGTAW